MGYGGDVRGSQRLNSSSSDEMSADLKYWGGSAESCPFSCWGGTIMPNVSPVEIRGEREPARTSSAPRPTKMWAGWQRGQVFHSSGSAVNLGVDAGGSRDQTKAGLSVFTNKITMQVLISVPIIYDAANSFNPFNHIIFWFLNKSYRQI